MPFRIQKKNKKRLVNLLDESEKTKKVVQNKPPPSKKVESDKKQFSIDGQDIVVYDENTGLWKIRK